MEKKCKKCKNCQESLFRREREKSKDWNARIFCNRTCAVTFSNKARKRTDLESRLSNKGNAVCVECNNEFLLTKNKKNKGFHKRKYCVECTTNKGLRKFGARTKGEIFSSRKNWQSARSSIRSHANKVFKLHSTRSSCLECGYSLHIEVAHIKAVKSFNDQELISVINSIDNLIPLCLTHHWEYDNGYLLLKT